PYIIDLMVVYTPQVLADYGGSISAVQALINQAVAYTNQSFVNSNILAELRVVRVEPVTYTESGSMYTDIYRLQNPSDGYMDNVPIDRNTYGADLVCLLESPPPLSAIAGLGFYSVTNGNAYPDYGYSVIEDSSNPQVMAHELGHNLGCNHDAANAAGIAAYSYSYGWRFTASGDTYICNMGYPPGGVIPYYSSPLVNYLGVPTGTSTADNARTINNTAPIVAGYRSTVMTNAYPDVNITSPTNGYIEYRPTPVTIMANASDSDGTIQQVDFYSDNNYLGTITNSPYNFPTVLNPGSHLLTAWATDNGGALRISCAVSIQVKSSLPSPWTENDIGMSQGPGFSSYNGVTMTLTGTGSDLTNSGNNDNFYFVSQTFCGDGSIIARLLDASSSPTADTEPGLMMREDLSPGAQYMGIDLFYNPYSPPVDPFYSWRTPAGSTVNWGGGVTFNLPYWTKIQRIGNIFNTYYSPDGVTWTSYSGPKTINMQQTIQAGLFIDNSNGGSPGAPVTAHFDNISVSMACAPPTSTNTPTNSPTLTPTKTPTNTPTLTPTNSPTGIWYTSTPTKTPTNNPTNTSTPTIVETIQGDTFPTFTPTPTNSFTPTNTPTLTDTYTPTLTATQTPTSTLTVTPTLTWTLTPTFTPTATDTPCLVFGNTCTPSLTP
ncbi:MAG TPA: M12 family metallo-peptidase, partial [bacterium]